MIVTEEYVSLDNGLYLEAVDKTDTPLDCPVGYERVKGHRFLFVLAYPACEHRTTKEEAACCGVKVPVHYCAKKNNARTTRMKCRACLQYGGV